MWYNTRMIGFVWGKVYLLTCAANGKQYVGQTTQNLKYRFDQHFYSSRKTSSSRRNTPLAKAIRKYGKDNFSISLLCSCSSQDELNLMEDLYIACLGTLVDNGGYNLERGGAKGKSSEATKALQSLQRRGNRNSRYIHGIDDTQIVSLYGEGNSAKSVAEKLGLRPGTVEKRLRKAGVSMRHPGRQHLSEEDRKIVGTRMKIRHRGEGNPAFRSDVSTEEIISLYQQGFGTPTIGKRLSLSARAVINRLRKSGITLRKQGTNKFSQVT